MPNPHDLTFVAPERRAEVQRRIAVIEHFIQKPGRKAAESAAANLGIGVAQFYNLVRAWRGSQRPENIASGGSLRRRRPRMTDEQIEVIQDTIARSPRATARALADDVIYRLASGAIENPSRDALLRYIRCIRPARLRKEAAATDLLVDHTVVDLPVLFGSIPQRPLVTAVIDVANDEIVGMALSEGKPNCEAIAAALSDAAMPDLRTTKTGSPKPTPITVVACHSDRTEDVASTLGLSGIEVRVEWVGAHGGGRHIEALLGSRRAGIQLRPRLIWSDSSRRLATTTACASPMNPDFAAQFIRSRLMPMSAGSRLGHFDDAG